jgi:TRAP-type C4-dicarboxylate transport system permease small subunit
MKLFDKILDAMCFIAKLIIAFIMFSVALDVFCRYVLNRPMVWVIPLSEYSLVYVTFLGTAWLLREEGHVSMETFTEKLGKGGQVLFGMGGSILGTIVSVIFTWYGTLTTIDHFKRGIYESAVMEMPIAPVLAIIPIGCFFLLVQFVRRIVKQCRTWEAIRRGEIERVPEDETSAPGV